MNKFPLWKYFAVIAALCLALVYAAPNLYPPDAAIQISVNSSSQNLSGSVLNRALAALKKEGVEVKASEHSDKSILIRLEDANQQLHAKEIIDQALRLEYIVALNLAPTTPDWLLALGAEPMKLGLDLSGGVHFLLEVDTQFAIHKRLDGYLSDMRKALREERVRGIIDTQDVELADIGVMPVITGSFNSEELRTQAKSLVKGKFANLLVETSELEDKFLIQWRIGEQEIKEVRDAAVSQNLTALRNRVNELGVSEPLVQKQGASRIVVELPGVQDSSTAKRIIGKTASLEFRLEADGRSASESFPFREGTSRRMNASLQRSVVITGENVTDAKSGFDENGRPNVSITLDGQGGKRMNAATRSNIGRNLGVLFIERKYRAKPIIDANGNKTFERTPYYQKEVISLATIQSALGVRFQITGLDSQQESQDLALLLRAGALAAPIDFVEERTIGPSLGAENIQLGVNAVIMGLIAVVIFMLIYYKVFGFAANLALAMNLTLIIAIMSILSATLTLPGIAGIVLTVGMAVDANVLIFARIREELKEGLTPYQAIESGYDRAFVTIMDANITTFLVAVILFAIGSGPVQGFAVTLMIGILTSMFTAIVATRAIIQLIYRNPRVEKLAI